jgi:hypothetical protein
MIDSTSALSGSASRTGMLGLANQAQWSCSGKTIPPIFANKELTKGDKLLSS